MIFFSIMTRLNIIYVKSRLDIMSHNVSIIWWTSSGQIMSHDFMKNKSQFLLEPQKIIFSINTGGKPPCTPHNTPSHSLIMFNSVIMLCYQFRHYEYKPFDFTPIISILDFTKIKSQTGSLRFYFDKIKNRYYWPKISMFLFS